MGKVKKVRQRLHLPAKSKPEKPDQTKSESTTEVMPIQLSELNDNIFEGIQINFDNLSKKLPEDDVQTEKSFKSVKTELGKSKIIPKRDKLKLRRELFMKKLDLSNSLRKESKMREKRKKVAIIGDTNPLFDALPSLQSLCKTDKADEKSSDKKKRPEKKKKTFEKSSKVKKNYVEGVHMFKQLIKNNSLKDNPLVNMSAHLKAVMERNRELNKKSK